MYNGYHSIDIYLSKDFDNPLKKKNTWEDFHLVAENRPYVAPPEPKYEMVDVPGRDGSLDYSDSLTGYPSYNNRTGSWDFIIVNDFFEPVTTHEEWYEAYSRVMRYIQGKKLYVILEDDREFYYEGRLHVSSYESEQNYSKITIDYTFNPYKWSIYSTLYNDWLWDPFNFYTGVIPDKRFKDIFIPSWKTNSSGYFTGLRFKSTTVKLGDLGPAPSCPTVIGRSYPDARCGNLLRQMTLAESNGFTFTLPGWSSSRTYNSSKVEQGIRIPEYTFRRDPRYFDPDLEIGELTVANKFSKSVPWGLFDELPSAYNTCEECGAKFDNLNISDYESMSIDIYEDESKVSIGCRNCGHIKDFPFVTKCPSCNVNYHTGGAGFEITDASSHYDIKCGNCQHVVSKPYVPDIGYISYDFRKGDF